MSFRERILLPPYTLLDKHAHIRRHTTGEREDGETRGREEGPLGTTKSKIEEGWMEKGGGTTPEPQVFEQLGKGWRRINAYRNWYGVNKREWPSKRSDSEKRGGVWWGGKEVRYRKKE